MKLFFHKVLKNRLVYHYVFWITLVISYLITHFYIVEAAGIGYYLLTTFIRNILLVILVYGNVSFLLPRFYQKRKYLLYTFWLVALMLLYTVAQSSYTVYFYKDVMHFSSGINVSRPFQLFDSFFTACRYTFISFILKLTLEWYDQKEKISSMQIEKLQAEINYLRAQINPHFIFNTLNSVYALTLKKSDTAPEVVMRLSKIMDYMLYDSNEMVVPLKKDIENLANYIELEKMRLNNSRDITFLIEGVPGGQFVLPLLFLPLVENAFKHGASQKMDDYFITIVLKVDNNSIDFLVKNKKPSAKLNGNAFITNRGLGLKNLKKRLALYYNGRYDFQINSSEDIYEANLKLKL